jgi:hypothetical protein
MKSIAMPMIKERISEMHKKFINSVGELPHKIAMDQKLIITRMQARINAIVKCFIDEEIIDDFYCINDVNKDGYLGICLYKKQFGHKVHIWSDGENIVIKSSNYPVDSGLDLDIIKLYDINIDDFNWMYFADQLLDFIHKIIYSRKKSLELKIFK